MFYQFKNFSSIYIAIVITLNKLYKNHITVIYNVIKFFQQ